MDTRRTRTAVKHVNVNHTLVRLLHVYCIVVLDMKKTPMAAISANVKVYNYKYISSKFNDITDILLKVEL